MNDKDKEAFDEWFIKTYRYDYKDLVIPESIKPQKEAWQAACSHKQKEIDDLKLEYDKLTDWASEYVAENAELKQKILNVWKEAEEFYLDD